MFSGIIQCRHKYKTIKRDTAPPGVGLGQESGSTKQLFPSKTLCSRWLLWPVANQPEILQFPAGRGDRTQKEPVQSTSNRREENLSSYFDESPYRLRHSSAFHFCFLFRSRHCSALCFRQLPCYEGKTWCKTQNWLVPFRFACFLWYYCGISLTEYLSLSVFRTIFRYRNQTLYRSDEDIHRGNIICHAG